MTQQLLLSAVLIPMILASLSTPSLAQTIALWPFDEQQGLYPSSVLSDVSSNDCLLVLGLGGQGPVWRAAESGSGRHED